MKKTIKLNKNRKSAAELLKTVVNEDLLKQRKEENEKKKTPDETKLDTSKIEKKELKWFEKPILEKDFIFKCVDGEYFAQHKDWNKKVWIGGYPSEAEAKQVVKEYCKECKKKLLDRNIKNIHSILFDEE